MTYQRAGHTATLLSSGLVLVAGGGPANAELYEMNASFPDSWRPTITLVTPVLLSVPIGIEGNLFRGISEASGGNGSQNSPTNYPLVVLRSADNQHVRFLMPDPVAGWSDTTFTSVTLTNFPTGAATLTVITNGIPSLPKSVMVESKPGGK